MRGKQLVSSLVSYATASRKDSLGRQSRAWKPLLLTKGFMFSFFLCIANRLTRVRKSRYLHMREFQGISYARTFVQRYKRYPLTTARTQPDRSPHVKPKSKDSTGASFPCIRWEGTSTSPQQIYKRFDMSR
jgi:hypothetical protein